MAGEAPTHLDLMGIRAWGGVALALAALAGWLGGSLWLADEWTDPEEVAPAAELVIEVKYQRILKTRRWISTEYRSRGMNLFQN